ncbi:DUF2167 domain-containing protein [Labrys monachus]|uniref:Membrane-anchored protein n=1 Tax=Labrys monachus TaxID=217067 RepID=A0ABU0FG14_9HYPH|nr:DUF2167 domain-containing protein [Labrys monachus]MDQ0393550.1 putative membrane-anchored protein [Labrys monachus]
MAAKTLFFLIGLAAGALAGFSEPAMAEAPSGAEQAQRLQSAVDAMQKVLVPGPGTVPLAAGAGLRVPAGAAFVRQPEAGAWAAASGYEPDKDLVGMVTPMVEGANWVIFLDYHPGGHVSDADARAWNADALLQALRASTAQGNAGRAKRDLPQLEVTGWLERPDYDAAAHRLIWAAKTSEIGDGDEPGSGNIHGFVLGRDGYAEMTMVAPSEEIASYTARARAVLAGIAFGAGGRYEEYAGAGAGERSITALISPAMPAAPSRPSWETLLRTWPFGLAVICVLLLVVLRIRRFKRR